MTLALYRRAFSRAGQLALRNWPVLGTVFVYAVVMTTSVLVASRLGLLGGFLLSLVWASCVGSFLYLVVVADLRRPAASRVQRFLVRLPGISRKPVVIAASAMPACQSRLSVLGVCDEQAEDPSDVTCHCACRRLRNWRGLMRYLKALRPWIKMTGTSSL